jgi:hypothetical protein
LAGSVAEGWPPLQMVAAARPSRVPPASSRSQRVEIRPSIQLPTRITISLGLLHYFLSSCKVKVGREDLRVQEVRTARISGPQGPKKPV